LIGLGESCRTVPGMKIFRDESEEWHPQGAQSCAHWLTWRIGLDRGAAREKVRVARALGLLPRIDEAFGAGRLSSLFTLAGLLAGIALADAWARRTAQPRVASPCAGEATENLA